MNNPQELLNTYLAGRDAAKKLQLPQLTQVESIVMWYLYYAPYTERVSYVLAPILQTTPQHVTKILRRLENCGLIEKRSHPSDQRVRFIVLTRKGRQELEEQMK